MKTKKRPYQTEEVVWWKTGEVQLSGAWLSYYRALDVMFSGWAHRVGAIEVSVPTTIAQDDLKACGYLESFPHIANVACSYGHDTSSRVLTPAACYHFYIDLTGCRFDRPVYRTTTAKCFRREDHYEPLRRQWSFSMREIACIGTEQEVSNFLNDFQDKLACFFDKAGFHVEFLPATDPFFRSSEDPRWVMQRLQPLKLEMTLPDGTAIGSLNFHKQFFGEAYDIKRDGSAVFTGCVAFGLERWLHACRQVYGENPETWPEPGA